MSKSNPLTPEQAKKRQKLILGGILVAVMGGSFAGIAMTSKKDKANPAQQKVEARRSTITAPGSQLDQKDVWTAKSAAQLTGMESDLKQTEDANKVLQDRLKALEEAQKNGGTSPGINKPQLDAKNDVKLPPVPPLPSSKSLPPLPKVSSASMQLPPPPPIGKGGKPGLPDLGQPDFKPRGIMMETLDDTPAAGDAKLASAATPAAMHTAGSTVTHAGVHGYPAATVHSVANYIPSGSFVRAVVLGGIDAPTGGQAQSNPQPVLLRLTNNAILPNRYRSQVKECFVVGAGFGDISSERAYIRTESLSCVLKNGQAIDLPVKGYIADETGKAGMKGRLVTKQGQILANALVAGLASGFGDILQARATTTSVSALGATQTTTPGQEINAGLGAGVGKALDRLSQYYITLADKIFPVIEVDAGRTVDVVFTKGVVLENDATETSEAGDYIAWVRRQQRHGY